MIGTKSGHRIPETMRTAPDLLSECGYWTIGVSENSYAGEAKGFDERFDDFTKSVPSGIHEFFSRQLGYSLLKYAFKAREHGPGLTPDIDAHGKQMSFFTTDITKRKLKRASKKQQPFFCYVHYNDPHHPYIPPLSYQNEYVDEIESTAETAIAFAQQMHDHQYEWMAEGLPLSDGEWEMLYAMYDAVIKYTDSNVGSLFDFVQERFENTIVIITADHGDLFGEYGLLGHHMVLHDGLIHVPMVTHGLDGVSHHVENPTQHIDLMQTLLSVVDADTSQFQGYDLRAESREIAISQDLRGTVDDTESQSYERIRQYNPAIDLSHLPESMVTAARTTEFKLVRTEEWSKLYHLPNEEDDVSEDHSAGYNNLNALLNEWMDTEGSPFEEAPEKPALSEDTEQHLREMGYL